MCSGLTGIWVPHFLLPSGLSSLGHDQYPAWKEGVPVPCLVWSLPGN